MTNDETNNDLFDELRAANPFAGTDSTPPTNTSADARFKEITMLAQEPTTTTRRSPAAAPPPWWRRPLIAAPTALAIVAILAVGALVISAVTAPSAYALVNEAAMNSASFDSGRVVIAIEFRELPEDNFDGNVTIDYRYDGDDFAMAQDLDMSVFAEGGDFETIQVDDALYVKMVGFGDGDSYLQSPIDGDRDFMAGGGFAVNPDAMSPAAIVGVLERAADFAEVESTDDTTTYRGSVATNVLFELGAENLPPGLSLLAEDNGDLPETIAITATLKDENVQQLVVDITGDTPAGYTDATMTIAFSELGEPQGIVAPSPDEILPEDAMEDFVMPEGFDDSLAVLEEMEARRPGLCDEVFASFLDPASDGIEIGQIEEINEAFATCLDNEGEPEAAEAFRSISDLSSSN